MIKKLSNTLILLSILSNQLLVAQLDEFIESGVFDRACERGMGPWYFFPNDGDNPVDLTMDDLIIIEEDGGVICFCPGESQFSGVVTARDITLYGNGDANEIIVSPNANYYFNLIAVTNQDLISFTNSYELQKTLTNVDDKLNISIKNITFTRNYDPSQKFSMWLDLSETNHLEDLISCLTEVGLRQITLQEYLEDVNSEDVTGCVNEFGELGLSLAALIQINRPNTSLDLMEVSFKEFSNITSIIEYVSNGEISIQNVDIINNRPILGLLLFDKFKNLSISNLQIKNNTQSSIYFAAGTSVYDDPKIDINGLDIVENRDLTFHIWSRNFKLTGQSLHFRMNKWRYPFMLWASDRTFFDINKLSFINNLSLNDITNNLGDGFGIHIGGSGTITDSEFIGNSFKNGFQLRSKKTIFVGSVFKENTILFHPYLLMYIGNLEFVQTNFIDNDFHEDHNSVTSLPFSILYPRLNIEYNVEDHYLREVVDHPALYTDLRLHELNLEYVKFSQDDHNASIVSINDFVSRGLIYFHYGQRTLPRDIRALNEIITHGELNRAFPPDIYSIYKFDKIDYLNCGYEQNQSNYEYNPQIYKCLEF